MFKLPVILLCLTGLGPVYGQNFTVPSGWRETTSNLTRAERAKLASDATAKVTPLINPGTGYIANFAGGQAASTVAILANQDLYNGNNSHKDAAVNTLQEFERAFPNFYSANPATIQIANATLQRINSDDTYWGLVAYYCYRAYGDQFLLDIASTAWDVATQYVVTEANAKNGSHPTRNVTIASTCNNATTAGGVLFDVDKPNSTDVNGETAGSYLSLSAYLYEATNQTKYLDAAELTAKFIQNQLWDGAWVHDTIRIQSCEIVGAFLSYNPGFFIEGLAVLANITRDANWTSLLEDVLPKTINYKGLINFNGIIIEETENVDDWSSALKVILIRALHETWARIDKSSEMAALIEAFITVQMNAVLDFATIPGSNNYTTSWIGPTLNGLHPAGNAAAVDVFNAAFDLVPDTPGSNTTFVTFAFVFYFYMTDIYNSNSTEPPSNGSDGSQNSTKSSTSHAGAIAGGVVGGVAVIALIIGCFVFWRRRRIDPYSPENGNLLESSQSSLNPAYVVEPFPVEATFTTPSGAIGIHRGMGDKQRTHFAWQGAGMATPSPGPSTVTSDVSSPSQPIATNPVMPQVGSSGPVTVTSGGTGEHVPVDHHPGMGGMSDLPRLVSQLAGLLHVHVNEAPPEYREG
ncbi:hypothetical protein OF83DRAFT_1085592 [Amylostereum chailletii]|nr:hypothetical protein OF83DRAFT_1085592 [Amylostereum chailletii]